jgi:hypothetical protein
MCPARAAAEWHSESFPPSPPAWTRLLTRCPALCGTVAQPQRQNPTLSISKDLHFDVFGVRDKPLQNTPTSRKLLWLIRTTDSYAVRKSSGDEHTRMQMPPPAEFFSITG